MKRSYPLSAVVVILYDEIFNEATLYKILVTHPYSKPRRAILLGALMRKKRDTIRSRCK
jgi:hypothetical protein